MILWKVEALGQCVDLCKSAGNAQAVQQEQEDQNCRILEPGDFGHSANRPIPNLCLSRCVMSCALHCMQTNLQS